MSLKAKLSLFISGIVFIILALNTILNYYSSRDALMTQTEIQMKMVAKEIGISVEHAHYTSQYVEDQMGNNLRLAAIAALHELSPDIANVSNEQLVLISRKLGVSHISLFKQVDGDIKVLKSSDPKEINLSTKDWGFWYQAFQQLFANQKVVLTEGQALANYWSGPYAESIADAPLIGKWGYYYDGTTNYIINPYMLDTDINGFEQIVGAAEVLDKTMKEHKDLLEITGFNPLALTKTIEKQESIVKERVDGSKREILFGSYIYQDQENDINLINKAYQTGETLTNEVNILNKHILKNYIPALSIKGNPYVISVVIDYSIIQNLLNKQLFNQIIISLVLLLGTIAFSYNIASYSIRPLTLILKKVNEISEGIFTQEHPYHRNNEWGILSKSIFNMSLNLYANTEQLRQTNEKLRNTKQYMESFANHTSDAFVVVDLQGLVQQANNAYILLYGWSMDETVGFPEHTITEPYQSIIKDVMLKVKNGIPVSAFENVCQTKDGKLIDVSTTISGIHDEKDELVAYASISRDITERRNTDELLRRSEKLSIVGQLAAGVAHEIRNPLTTLRGFVQLQQGKGNQQHLDIMLSELDRINFIVSEFLILAKPQAINFQKRDLVYILQDIISLLASQANLNNIQFIFDFAPHIPLINCEENQLKQVFINIIKNGMESMPNGGEIKIQIGNLVSDDVMVRIVDQGCGISEEELARLGEPFYTNKETGTGLGLMVSQQIIANHKGSMHFESELDRGTTVEIILPMS
jgi:PAS domain S-box-containing protein